jgi:uncharacterized protein
LARSPLLIGVTELRRRPGTQRQVHLAASVPGLAITTARVPDGTEVELDGVLEAVEGGITLTGTVRAPWTAECRRCLEEVTGTAEIEVSEVFEARPVPGETYPIDGDDVDLEPVLRDAVLLHLPLAPLCREDCLGPAPEVFPAARADDEGPPEDAAAPGEPPRDPRWAALDVLRTEADDDG